MNSRFFVPVLIAFLCLIALIPANADTPLADSMKQMGKVYKELALDLKQPLDANKSDYLTLVSTMKTNAQTARGLVPKKAAALPADQQTTMVQDYQKSMDDLIKSFDALAQAIQDGKWDDANKVMADIKQQMTNGHKTFRIKN